MPRIALIDPWGLRYDIATRQTETLLKAWFDELLPLHCKGRPVDDFDVVWPTVIIWPMWAGPMRNSDPDWLTDNRVLGRVHPFPAKDGLSALAALLRIRRELEHELRHG